MKNVYNLDDSVLGVVKTILYINIIIWDSELS